MQPPEQIGKYRLRAELGRGAMGVVYEAFDSAIERTVAIKLLDSDVLGGTDGQALRQRFRHEARAAGRLQHPHIVALYDYADSHVRDDGSTGSPYLVMECVQGRTLKSLLTEGRRPTPLELQAWMGALLQALQHAHERGVVHRDIKPANLMLQPDGVLKVADFGIARLDASELTTTGAMLGTLSYMAPEQLLGQAVDHRSDLYACGVLLYLLLTGHLPFEGPMAQVMEQALHLPPPLASAIDARLAPWDPVLARALAKDPNQRFASAREFGRAVADAGRSMAGQSAPPVAGALPAAVPEPMPGTPRDAPPDDPEATLARAATLARPALPAAGAPGAPAVAPHAAEAAGTGFGAGLRSAAAAFRPRLAVATFVVGLGLAGAWQLSQPEPQVPAALPLSITPALTTPGPQAATPAPATATRAGSAALPTPDDVELQAWERAARVHKAAVYQAYLQAYPRGRFVPLARLRLAELDDPQRRGSSPPARD